MTRGYEYDVALSFAGEDREHADALAKLLQENGYKVFYDKFETAHLWGKNLYEHFLSVYRDKSRFCVIFMSEDYKQKKWTNHERRSALERTLQEKSEYILPIKVDSEDIPGILLTTGYLDLSKITVPDIFKALEEKIVKDRELTAQSMESVSDDAASAAIEPRTDDPKIIDRIENRVESLFDTDMPTITVTARPTYLTRPLMSLDELNTFAQTSHSSVDGSGFANWLCSSKVVDGLSASTLPGKRLGVYWELNKYGVLYTKRAFRYCDKDRYAEWPLMHEGEQQLLLHSSSMPHTLGGLLHYASAFYNACGYTGNIDAAIQLRNVGGEFLFYNRQIGVFHESVPRYYLLHHPYRCLDQEVSQATRRPTAHLSDAEKMVDLIDVLTAPLLWAFNVDVEDQEKRTAKIRSILMNEELLPSIDALIDWMAREEAFVKALQKVRLKSANPKGWREATKAAQQPSDVAGFTRAWAPLLRAPDTREAWRNMVSEARMAKEEDIARWLEAALASADGWAPWDLAQRAVSRLCSYIDAYETRDYTGSGNSIPWWEWTEE